MSKRRGIVFILLTLLIGAPRLPAPIQEVPVETAAPLPEQSPAPGVNRSSKQSASPAPKVAGRASIRSTPNKEPRLTSSANTATPRARSLFAGTWTGVTHTFPWGDISQTITVDPSETRMTMVSVNGPDSAKPGVADAQRYGDTLKANFGLRGIYTLTALSDGSTVLVRLQAPFNDSTACYHRTAGTPPTAGP
jgi:hypothetical protein